VFCPSVPDAVVGQSPDSSAPGAQPPKTLSSAPKAPLTRTPCVLSSLNDVVPCFRTWNKLRALVAERQEIDA
jgi:hypothetical protein